MLIDQTNHSHCVQEGFCEVKNWNQQNQALDPFVDGVD